MCVCAVPATGVERRGAGPHAQAGPGAEDQPLLRGSEGEGQATGHPADQDQARTLPGGTVCVP